jgi:hypothetical protein
MENNRKTDEIGIDEIDPVEAVRQAKVSGDLEEAIRSLIRVHTASDADGSVTVLWGALPNDDPASYRLYRAAWARVADALRRGDFRDVAPAKKAAE